MRAVEELKAIAPNLSIALSFMAVRTREELAPAFADIKQAGSQAIYVIDDPIFFTHRMFLNWRRQQGYPQFMICAGFPKSVPSCRMVQMYTTCFVGQPYMSTVF